VKFRDANMSFASMLPNAVLYTAPNQPLYAHRT
jgi:hypothetical protein